MDIPIPPYIYLGTFHIRLCTAQLAPQDSICQIKYKSMGLDVTIKGLFLESVGNCGSIYVCGHQAIYT